jgi:hypothetical protein
VTADWRESEAASRRVADLLEKAGLPLELKVWNEAERFRKKNSRQSYSVTTERIIYRKDEGSPAREVDFSTLFYQDFPLTEKLDIQLILNVVIECKYRQDVEIFGFPRPRQLPAVPQYVIESSLKGSRLGGAVFSSAPAGLTANTLGFGLVQIEHGQTPQRIHDEEIIYKAGASLYDYIAFSARDSFDELRPTDVGSVIANKVTEYLSSGAWVLSDESMADWLNQEITLQEFERFEASRVLPVTAPTQIFLPVVCVNGPIYRVSVGVDGRPLGFTPEAFLVSGLRAPGWPPSREDRYAPSASEVPIIVTNPDGLGQVFTIASIWFRSAILDIRAFPEDVKNMAIIEAIFSRRAYDGLVDLMNRHE